ncbi:hypothetical protein ABPG72_006058 [Tetrahymena utriculariae]
MDKQIAKKLLKLNHEEAKKSLELSQQIQELQSQQDIENAYIYFKKLFLNQQEKDGLIAENICKNYIYVSILIQKRKKSSQLPQLEELKHYLAQSTLSKEISSTLECLLDIQILKDCLKHENVKRVVQLIQKYIQKIKQIQIDRFQHFTCRQTGIQLNEFQLQITLQICEVLFLYGLTLYDITKLTNLPQALLEIKDKINDLKQQDQHIQICLQFRYHKIINSYQDEDFVKTYLFIHYQTIKYFYDRAIYFVCITKIDTFISQINNKIIGMYCQRMQLVKDIQSMCDKFNSWRDKCLTAIQSPQVENNKVNSLILKRISQLIYDKIYEENRSLVQTNNNLKQNINNRNKTLKSEENKQNIHFFTQENQYKHIQRLNNPIKTPLESRKNSIIEVFEQINKKDKKESKNKQRQVTQVDPKDQKPINSIDEQFNLVESIIIYDFEIGQQEKIISDQSQNDLKKKKEDFQIKNQELKEQTLKLLQSQIVSEKESISQQNNSLIEESIDKNTKVESNEFKLANNIPKQNKFTFFQPKNKNPLYNWFQTNQTASKVLSEKQQHQESKQDCIFEQSKRYILNRIKDISQEKKTLHKSDIKIEQNKLQNNFLNIKSNNASIHKNNQNSSNIKIDIQANNIYFRQKEASLDFQNGIKTKIQPELSPYQTLHQKNLQKRSGIFKNQEGKPKNPAIEVGVAISQIKARLKQIEYTNNTQESNDKYHTNVTDYVDTILKDQNISKNKVLSSSHNQHQSSSSSLFKRSQSQINLNQIFNSQNSNVNQTSEQEKMQQSQLKFYNTSQILLNISQVNTPINSSFINNSNQFLNNSTSNYPIILNRKLVKNKSFQFNKQQKQSDFKVNSPKKKFFQGSKNQINFTNALNDSQTIQKSNTVSQALKQKQILSEQSNPSYKSPRSKTLSIAVMQDQANLVCHYLTNSYQQKQIQKIPLSDKPNLMNIYLKNSLSEQPGFKIRPKFQSQNANLTLFDSTYCQEATIRDRTKTQNLIKCLHQQQDQKKEQDVQKIISVKKKKILSIKNRIKNALITLKIKKLKKIIEIETLTQEEKTFKQFQEQYEKLKEQKSNLNFGYEQIPHIKKIKLEGEFSKNEIDLSCSHPKVKLFLRKQQLSKNQQISLFYKQNRSRQGLANKLFYCRDSETVEQSPTQEKEEEIDFSDSQSMGDSDESSSSQDDGDELNSQQNILIEHKDTQKRRFGWMKYNKDSKMLKLFYSISLVSLFIKKILRKYKNNIQVVQQKRQSVKDNIMMYFEDENDVLTQQNKLEQNQRSKSKFNNQILSKQNLSNDSIRNKSESFQQNKQDTSQQQKLKTNVFLILTNLKKFINKLFYKISGYNYPSHNFKLIKIYPPFKFYYRQNSWIVKLQQKPQEGIVIKSQNWRFFIPTNFYETREYLGQSGGEKTSTIWSYALRIFILYLNQVNLKLSFSVVQRQYDLTQQHPTNDKLTKKSYLFCVNEKIAESVTDTDQYYIGLFKFTFEIFINYFCYQTAKPTGKQIDFTQQDSFNSYLSRLGFKYLARNSFQLRRQASIAYLQSTQNSGHKRPSAALVNHNKFLRLEQERIFIKQQYHQSFLKKIENLRKNLHHVSCFFAKQYKKYYQIICQISIGTQVNQIESFDKLNVNDITFLISAKNIRSLKSINTINLPIQTFTEEGVHPHNILHEVKKWIIYGYFSKKFLRVIMQLIEKRSFIQINAQQKEKLMLNSLMWETIYMVNSIEQIFNVQLSYKQIYQIEDTLLCEKNQLTQIFQCKEYQNDDKDICITQMSNTANQKDQYLNLAQLIKQKIANRDQQETQLFSILGKNLNNNQPSEAQIEEEQASVVNNYNNSVRMSIRSDSPFVDIVKSVLDNSSNQKYSRSSGVCSPIQRFSILEERQNSSFSSSLNSSFDVNNISFSPSEQNTPKSRFSPQVRNNQQMSYQFNLKRALSIDFSSYLNEKQQRPSQFISKLKKNSINQEKQKILNTDRYSNFKEMKKYSNFSQASGQQSILINEFKKQFYFYQLRSTDELFCFSLLPENSIVFQQLQAQKNTPAYLEIDIDSHVNFVKLISQLYSTNNKTLKKYFLEFVTHKMKKRYKNLQPKEFFQKQTKSNNLLQINMSKECALQLDLLHTIKMSILVSSRFVFQKFNHINNQFAMNVKGFGRSIVDLHIFTPIEEKGSSKNQKFYIKLHINPYLSKTVLCKIIFGYHDLILINQEALHYLMQDCSIKYQKIMVDAILQKLEVVSTSLGKQVIIRYLQQQAIKKRAALFGKDPTQFMRNSSNTYSNQQNQNIDLQLEKLTFFKTSIERYSFQRDLSREQKYFLKKSINSKRIILRHIMKIQNQFWIITIRRDVVFKLWIVNFYSNHSQRNFQNKLSFQQLSQSFKLKKSEVPLLFTQKMIFYLNNKYIQPFDNYIHFLNRVQNNTSQIVLASKFQRLYKIKERDQPKQNNSLSKCHQTFQKVVKNYIQNLKRKSKSRKSSITNKLDYDQQLQYLKQITDQQDNSFQDFKFNQTYTNLYKFIEFYLWTSVFTQNFCAIQKEQCTIWFYTLNLKEIFFSNLLKLNNQKIFNLDIELNFKDFLQKSDAQKNKNLNQKNVNLVSRKKDFIMTKNSDVINYRDTAQLNFLVSIRNVNMQVDQILELNFREILNIFIGEGYFYDQSSYQNAQLNYSDIRMMSYFIFSKFQSGNFIDLIDDENYSSPGIFLQTNNSLATDMRKTIKNNMALESIFIHPIIKIKQWIDMKKRLCLSALYYTRDKSFKFIISRIGTRDSITIYKEIKNIEKEIGYINIILSEKSMQKDILKRLIKLYTPQLVAQFKECYH